MKLPVRSIFRFDELLSMGAVSAGSLGFVGVGVGTLANSRPALLGVSILLLGIAAGLVLLRRSLRLQARAELMSWLPPARAQHAKVGWGGDWQGLWRRDGGLAEDNSGGLQLARPGSGDAATRAVLASLHDALRADQRTTRPARPACRRARLRELGRDSTFRFRRRAPARRVESPS
jgi:hypothetical protein